MKQNLTDIVKKVKTGAIITVATAVTGLMLYAGIKAMREDKAEERFLQTPAVVELNETYQQQLTAIDTPYIRQRIAIEKAYKLQKDSLRKEYINNLDK